MTAAKAASAAAATVQQKQIVKEKSARTQCEQKGEKNPPTIFIN